MKKKKKKSNNKLAIALERTLKFKINLQVYDEGGRWLSGDSRRYKSAIVCCTTYAALQ
jgi:hypothetical protein